MNSPEFKVYDLSGTYQACTKEPHAAVMLAEHYSGVVKWMHRHVVWNAAIEQSGGTLNDRMSNDYITMVVWQRCEALRKKKFDKDTNLIAK